MLLTFHRVVLLLISSLLTASAATSIGIHLGPTYLSSAYPEDVKDGFGTISIKGSDAYRGYLADVLQTQAAGTVDPGHDDVAARAVFYDALMGIKTATEEKLGHVVEIGTVSEPLYFNETTTAVLRDAISRIQTRGAGQVTRFANAARLAYGLNSCEGFGMNSSNCDMEEGEHSVVVVDYNIAYLELAIGYVRADICSVRGYKRVEELGEDQKFSASYVGDVQKVLQEFRGTYFATFDFWDYGAHVRGVVLSGDASKSAMDEMRGYLQQAWPEQYETRLKDSLDPFYVGAIGAARMTQIEALRASATKMKVQKAEEEDDAHKHGEL